MASVIELEFTNTHLYLGARGRVVSHAGPPDEAGRAEAMITFADGVRAPGEITAEGDRAWRLVVAPYVTAAGARIGRKVWLVAGGAESGAVRIAGQAGT